MAWRAIWVKARNSAVSLQLASAPLTTANVTPEHIYAAPCNPLSPFIALLRAGDDTVMHSCWCKTWFWNRHLQGCLCAGIAHLMGSLNKEAAAAGEPVRVHCLSPGMVLTDLLLAGATDRNKQVCTCSCTPHPADIVRSILEAALPSGLWSVVLPGCTNGYALLGELRALHL